jgi:excisionase family DNA binding protein
MDTLLSAKQVQQLLHIDRTTIYRMLKEGRLTGVKVGQQWRFYEREINELLGVTVSSSDKSLVNTPTDVLPLNCMQPIQNVFAEIAGVAAVTTTREGVPLTRISNSCDFCKLILGSEGGRQKCITSWRKLAERKEAAPEFISCHAGLQYARAQIEVNGNPIALLVAGQFYTTPPASQEEQQRIEQLAKTYSIDEALLTQAAQQIQTLDARKIAQLTNWLEEVARTFEQITSERADLMSRLRQIAEMSVFEKLN